MITDSGRGLLVDWDLSKFLIANAVLDSPPERTVWVAKRFFFKITHVLYNINRELGNSWLLD
jgi:hypothetical protein